MMYFCTLFDSNYISKGLALYLSIANHTDDFLIFVMAMDRKCMVQLSKLNLPHIKVVCLEDYLTPELSEAKSNRSHAEFCWTCGSYVTHHFLTAYKLPDITYLDSDLMFFSSPKVIFDELEAKHASIGLSPHFIPYNATGKYCVQYCYFKNDEYGLSALTWWKNECLKWCYSSIENGKYGDQMYLDKMPELFPNVCDIENRGAGLAYWNSYAYKYTDNGVLFSGKLFPYVYFHFSGFSFSYGENILYVREFYPVNRSIRAKILTHYTVLLKKTYTDLLNLPVEKIEFIQSYSNYKRILHYIDNELSQYGQWCKIKSKFIRLKYAKRRSPYSENRQSTS